MNAPIRTPLGLLVPLLTLLLSAAAASFARAQTMFFDDFSGPDFHPRWNTPGPSGSVWTYDFENSMFNLRSVRATMPGKIPWRRVDIGTVVDLPGDFTITARVGWTAGGPARQIGIELTGEPFIFAELYMDEWLRGTPTFYWSVGPGGRGNAPAPLGAMVDLTLQRRGSIVRALINDTEVASASRDPDRIRTLVIILLGDSRAMQPLHVDSVSVIPSPGTIVLGGSVGLLALLQRRRSHARYLGRR